MNITKCGEKIMDYTVKNLVLIFSCVSSTFCVNLNSFKYGFHEFKETFFIKGVLLYIDLRPSQTCHSKVMHRKEVTHSDGSYEKKSRRWAWLKNGTR